MASSSSSALHIGDHRTAFDEPTDGSSSNSGSNGGGHGGAAAGGAAGATTPTAAPPAARLTPRHSILKHDSEHHMTHKPSGIHWNEAVIAEHDAERGQVAKIDEPKTPFQTYVLPDSDAESASPRSLASGGEPATTELAGALQAKLENAAAEAPHMDEEVFNALRAQHYSHEFELVKKFRDEHAHHAHHHDHSRDSADHDMTAGSSGDEDEDEDMGAEVDGRVDDDDEDEEEDWIDPVAAQNAMLNARASQATIIAHAQAQAHGHSHTSSPASGSA